MIARRWLNTTAALTLIIGGAELVRPVPAQAAQDGICMACGPILDLCEASGDGRCREMCGSIFYAVGCYQNPTSTCVECSS